MEHPIGSARNDKIWYNRFSVSLCIEIQIDSSSSADPNTQHNCSITIRMEFLAWFQTFLASWSPQYRVRLVSGLMPKQPKKFVWKRHKKATLSLSNYCVHEPIVNGPCDWAPQAQYTRSRAENQLFQHVVCNDFIAYYIPEERLTLIAS